MKQKGQALVLVAVVLPVLLLSVGVLIRSGQTAYYHYRVQKVIDRKALDLLQIQAEGLSQLGDINPYAKSVIDTRRVLEKALKACKFFCAPLVVAIAKLRITQGIIAAQQMAVRAGTFARVQEKKWSFLPPDVRGKVTLSYPSFETTLLVKKKSNYENEMGAPLALENDFSNRQKIEIKANMNTEKFLINWKKTDGNSFKELKAMTINTLAKVEMDDLEKEWTVQLRKSADRQ